MLIGSLQNEGWGMEGREAYHRDSVTAFVGRVLGWRDRVLLSVSPSAAVELLSLDLGLEGGEAVSRLHGDAACGGHLHELDLAEKQ